MPQIRRRKRFGQNFLTDKNIARKIIKAIDAPHPRFLIEIGPGKGVLTEFALDQVNNYLGVEIDPSLVDILKDRFSKAPNFSLIQQDFLGFDLPDSLRQYPGHSKTILGNIPYNITSPILFKLFNLTDSLDQAVLMVQKEVGNRIRAKEGGRDYGLLSIFSQLFADVNYLFSVPSKFFFPQPKVDSAVLKFNFHKKVKEQFADFELFRQIIRTCFQQRRKMLRNSLRHLFSEEVLSKLTVSLTRRPEQLSIPEWKKLFREIYQLAEKGDSS